MPVKTKKAGASARFGPRYGKTIRADLVNVERRQRRKQKCPFCEKTSVKRVAKGIWHCSKCDKKFASNSYYLS